MGTTARQPNGKVSKHPNRKTNKQKIIHNPKPDVADFRIWQTCATIAIVEMSVNAIVLKYRHEFKIPARNNIN